MPVLWHLEVSHYNEKARWALDYKRVPHVRRAVTPVLQDFRARRLRAGRTLPVLKLNGRAIGDSTRIIEEIERRWPEPPLYPSDPEERRRALELEDYFDEQCGHDLRRVLFNDNLARARKVPRNALRPRPPPTRSAQGTESATRTRCEVALLDPAGPRRALARGGPGRARRVEAEAGRSGYLVGDSFTVADLTAASILAPIVVPPEFPYIKLHPDERATQSRDFAPR